MSSTSRSAGYRWNAIFCPKSSVCKLETAKADGRSESARAEHCQSVPVANHQPILVLLSARTH